ncbi:AAA domain-containing protein [Alkalihalobacillus sp. CinArs1]|uniref:AAA domain-containing protein n=1 Tax=Alkalihalobacillus sp. CinArs1 TaxID=2995314 RepID=UPI0022DD9BBC|nr:AAA domain-containing protein [Alkalihalobacillus sp. CinArs1]
MKQIFEEWQKALQSEILYLKKFGSKPHRIINGQLLSSNNGEYRYYFETTSSVQIPTGSKVRLEIKDIKREGRILSSEGSNVIVKLEGGFGTVIKEARLFHDPWELLEELILRLDEIKESKVRSERVKRLMNPSKTTKHPENKVKNSLHELILRSKYNPVTYVWGPPGTGKTHKLARTAANHYFKGARVLILSHSNQAVDVLMKETVQFTDTKDKFEEGKIMRYGSQRNISSHLPIFTDQLLLEKHPGLAGEKERLVEERKNLKQDLSKSFSRRDSEELVRLESKLANVLEKIRVKEAKFVKEAAVVGTTLSRAAIDETIYRKRFDLVIVDEASMAYVPQAAFAASLGKKVIICGDFKQLPPIASGRSSLITKWLREDIFYCSGIVRGVDESSIHPNLFLLNEQRRTHPAISSFTNHHIYHSLVKDHPSTRSSRAEIARKHPFKDQPSVLLDTSNTGQFCFIGHSSKSRMNIWQLLLSFQAIYEAIKDGMTSIGYVTPYRAQANLMNFLIEDLLEVDNLDLLAATVHRFQGSEKDMMVFDTVDGDPEDRAGMLITGANSERLINVAMTRTKGKFIHVSNVDFIQKKLSSTKTLRKLVFHQIDRGELVSPSQIGSWIKHPHPKLTWFHAIKTEQLFKEMKSAGEVLISIPYGTKLNKEWKRVINQLEDNVTIISSSKIEGVEDKEYINCTVSFPFVVTDRERMWIGTPFEGMRGTLPPAVAARLESPKVIREFLNQVLLSDSSRS